MTMDTDCWSTNTDDTALQDQHDSIGSITSSTYSVTPVGSLHQKENNKPKSLDERDVETIREPISKEGIRNPGWLTVLGTFIINFYTWGVLVSWGIFQVLYLDVYAGQTDEFRIAFVGTSASAIVLGMGLVSPWLVRSLGFRGMIILGSILCPLSMVLASFANELWMLYSTQGIMLGIGVGLCYTGSSTLPSYWFTSNRAFASGVAASGTCLGPMIFSPIIQILILHFGYRNALRILGGIGIVLTGTGTLLIRTRRLSLHADQQQDHQHKTSHAQSNTTMFTWPYIFYLLHSFLAPFGYVAPIFLSPSYASAIGATPELASFCLSIVEGANGVARILFGWLGDHGIGRMNVVITTTFASGVFTIAIWQEANTVQLYMVYLILFGLTSGVFSGLQPVIVAELVDFGRIQQGVGLSYFLSMFGHLFGTSIVGLLHIRTGAWLAPILFASSVTIAAALSVLMTRILICKRVFIKL